MRLIFILAAVVGLGWLGWKSFNKIIFPDEKPALSKPLDGGVVAPGLPPVPSSLVPSNGSPSASGLVDPLESINPPVLVEVIGVYTFKNRPVPPGLFGRDRSVVGAGKDSNGLEMSVDAGSNSWVLRGPPGEVEEVKRIASIIDVEASELDLDFCLVGVSNDWLRSFGLSMAWRSGAAWISQFTLGGDGSTLRLSSGNFAVDVDLELADSQVRLVSAPVIRCITGEPWEFTADQEVPIPTLSRSEGVVSTAYQYQQVGLGFQGTAYRAGPPGAFRLEVEQRNGSVEGTSDASDVPPRIKSQTLKSSLVVEVDKWSCLGGVTSWRVERQKRLFGVADSEEQELLLVFVRARDSLAVPPKAIPVVQGPGSLPGWSVEPWSLAPDEHPLLPRKGYRERLDAEIERVEADIRKRLGRPGAMR